MEGGGGAAAGLLEGAIGSWLRCLLRELLAVQLRRVKEARAASGTGCTEWACVVMKPPALLGLWKCTSRGEGITAPLAANKLRLLILNVLRLQLQLLLLLLGLQLQLQLLLLLKVTREHGSGLQLIWAWSPVARGRGLRGYPTPFPLEPPARVKVHWVGKRNVTGGGAGCKCTAGNHGLPGDFCLHCSGNRLLNGCSLACFL